jgi:hypothetical protein
MGSHDHGAAAREALAAKKQRKKTVKEKGFEGLGVSDVWGLANFESGAVPTGYPTYYLRPWTPLREEMNARKVQKVSQLPADRIKVFRRTTRNVPRLEDFLFFSARMPYVRLFVPVLLRSALKRLARLPEKNR